MVECEGDEATEQAVEAVSRPRTAACSLTAGRSEEGLSR